MGKEKKIQVRMRGRQTIRFNQIRELTLAEWKELKSQREDAAAEWIDTSDVDDWNDVEDFEAVVVDKDGKDIKPRDQYMGGAS